MTTPRSRHAARLRASRRRKQARARRLVVALALGVIVAVTLALTAFDSSGGDKSPTATVTPAPLPVTSAPPEPNVLASVGNLRIQSPVAEGGMTAVGFHGSENGALVLQPTGPQANEGLLARLWRHITGSRHTGVPWYQLEGGPLRTLDVGAVPGTDIYAPMDGTVVAIRDQIMSGRKVGDEVELRPSSAPSLVVSIENIHRDPALVVGANVAAGSSKLGTVADVSRYETQALARYGPDAGNNVSIQVFPSAALGA
jgi:hypothetical protein